MSSFFALVRKELRSCFNSPIAYVLLVSYLVFTSVWFFYLQRFAAQNIASMRSYFEVIPIVFIVLLPALTMRSWAEEKKMGTIEILSALPFRESALVLGKFSASFLILFLMLILSIPIPLTIYPLGNFEPGQIAGEYLGMLLLGGTGLAIGQCVSSVSRNQISALVSGVGCLLFFTLIGQASLVLDLSGTMSTIVHSISFFSHFDSFQKGVIDTRDVIYFLVIMIFFLMVNTKIIRFRKW